jgi:hypothetical protein
MDRQAIGQVIHARAQLACHLFDHRVVHLGLNEILRLGVLPP